ncbi:RagB/SusD family nutrient uptake outer membrane protein [Ferruginibacter lapsinanis]|uniref:RagB/SusD family nutrient uptake outer membrane protein n=1 Tax=Ferruginibacter lapsinanis TaxID=563172 RepID=UPI001E4F8703|nr:RagB/SusD family nutrient uptake outer membrane protein [Ferruginibacter lapsinanis]UEG49502.1 RagB/SusD family nutrient uptake outer membrane protein [Ferruginibacter lapsinanis]
MKNKMIKRIAYFALLLTGVTMLNSCKKYLDKQPISSVGPEVAFANEANAYKTLAGVYSQLAGENTYGKILSLYMMVDDDAMMGPTYNGGTLDQADRRSIAHYSVKPNNAEIDKPFKQLYTGIERANLCIKYIPQMDGFASNPNLKRLYGEALTLRAQFYFALITNWGDVPANFVPALEAPDLYAPKEDRDVIYDKLIDDLKVAIDLVPWRSAVPKDERITKGAVKGLLARIALHRGGYSLRRDRTMKRGSNYLEYYKIARDQCREIMDSHEHDLNPSYKAVFKDAILAHAIEPNGEVMFEVAMSGGAAVSSGRMGNYDGPAVFGVAGQQNAIRILPSYFYSFDSLDTRRDVTCAPYTNNADANRYMKNTTLGAISFGKNRLEWITNPSTFPNNNYNTNWVLLRYSDILLMYAEAVNEINGGPTEEAKEAFAKVRTRAFDGNASLIGTIPSDYAGFFEAIVRERSFEFGGEGIRKYDLIRWNRMASTIADTKAKLATIITGINPYSPFDSIPVSMMYKTNSTTLVFANSFYHKTPSSTPTGFVKANWLTGYNAAAAIYYNFAQFFEPNHSELMPIHQDVISDYQGKLTQDYGY